MVKAQDTALVAGVLAVSGAYTISMLTHPIATMGVTTIGLPLATAAAVSAAKKVEKYQQSKNK